MSYCENLTQKLAVVGYTPPATVAPAGTAAITGIDMSYFRRVLFVVAVGSVTATGSVKTKIQACSTSGGTYVDVDATNAATASMATSNKIALLEARAEDLSAAAVAAGYSSYRYLGCLSTVSTANVLFGVVVLAEVARNDPASLQNIAAVTSIVVY